MAMKETASKCFIALTLCDILDDMETIRKQGEEQGDGFKEGLQKGIDNIVK